MRISSPIGYIATVLPGQYRQNVRSRNALPHSLCKCALGQISSPSTGTCPSARKLSPELSVRLRHHADKPPLPAHACVGYVSEWMPTMGTTELFAPSPLCVRLVTYFLGLRQVSRIGETPTVTYAIAFSTQPSMLTDCNRLITHQGLGAAQPTKFEVEMFC